MIRYFSSFSSRGVFLAGGEGGGGVAKLLSRWFVVTNPLILKGFSKI